MSAENIVNDLKRIIREQNLPLEVSNSIRFIMDAEEMGLNAYDIPTFKRLCRWADLNHDGQYENKMPRLYSLSEEFIYYFLEDLGWHKISRNIKLTEEFIEKHQDKVVWAMICQFQYLSEDFIERFSHKVKWDKISLGQLHLSEDFIWKHKSKLNMNNVLIFNKNISYNFKQKLRGY